MTLESPSLEHKGLSTVSEVVSHISLNNIDGEMESSPGTITPWGYWSLSLKSQKKTSLNLMTNKDWKNICSD